MASTNEIFCREVVGKRNLAALDDVYTAEARILPPGSPMVSGREAIKAFWGGGIEALHATACTLTSVEVMQAGDDIVEIGKAQLTVAPDGTQAQMEAKYVVYWRQEDGRWKWHVDIWNANA
jgi:ketosteroid isomerase-like protein